MKSVKLYFHYLQLKIPLGLLCTAPEGIFGFLIAQHIFIVSIATPQWTPSSTLDSPAARTGQ